MLLESKLSLCTYWELSFKRSCVMTLQRCMCVWNAAGVWTVSESSWKKGMREEQIFVFECLFLNDFHRRAFILLWCQKSVWKRGIPASRSRRESGPCAACTSPIALLRSQALFDDFTGLPFYIGPSASGLAAIDSRFHAEFKVSFIPDMVEFN